MKIKTLILLLLTAWVINQSGVCINPFHYWASIHPGISETGIDTYPDSVEEDTKDCDCEEDSDSTQEFNGNGSFAA